MLPNSFILQGSRQLASLISKVNGTCSLVHSAYNTQGSEDRAVLVDIVAVAIPYQVQIPSRSMLHRVLSRFFSQSASLELPTRDTK